jgi:hypothetical protein
MTRAEARQTYLEFTRALRSHFPVFQNTNMLYHELKSHYFLYLVKHGSWDALRERVLEPAVAGSADALLQPRRRARLLERGLAYDRGEIDRIVSSIDSATIRPRYQSDLLDEDVRASLDRELDALYPSASTLVYNPSSGEVQCLSPAAAELLVRCDGSRTLEEVVELVPAEHRPDAERCVLEIARAGLFDPEPRAAESLR